MKVTDPVRYSNYTRATPAVIQQYGGRFIVRGGPIVTLEGSTEDARIVVIEFPSLERAQAFYHSPEYTAVRSLREGAAEGQFLAIEGASS